MMSLDEIKAAVDAGQTVHWHHEGYTVIKDNLGQYLIGYNIGGPRENYTGLTWRDGKTFDYDPADFFIAWLSKRGEP
jgi:hypothetical protein